MAGKSVDDDDKPLVHMEETNDDVFLGVLEASQIVLFA
jgi:hypothetical protein